MDSTEELHEIQEKILKRLGYGESKSFSEIKGDIESNKFSFHLKKLRERGLIEKVDEGYRTTRNGRELLPYFDLKTSRHPVTVVDLLVFSEDKVFLDPKDSDPLDPFSGDYRTPSVRVGRGDRIKETANELYEDTFGDSPENMERAAVIDSKITFSDGSEQHYILFFLKTEKHVEKMLNIDELEDTDLLPGLDKVIGKIHSTEELVMGEWDIEETSNGFQVRNLEL